MIDVMTRLPDGNRYRERRRLRVSKSAAHRWGEDRERYVLQHGPAQPKKEVPTLEEFAPGFSTDTHAPIVRSRVGSPPRT